MFFKKKLCTTCGESLLHSAEPKSWQVTWEGVSYSSLVVSFLRSKHCRAFLSKEDAENFAEKIKLARKIAEVDFLHDPEIYEN